MSKALAPTTKPHEIGGYRDGTEHEHPAFGVITTCNTSQGGPGATLFGSKIKHGHYVSVEIREATLTRNLSNDWIHGTRILLRFSMSEAQFAQMTSSHGKGNGTPITLEAKPAEPYKLERVPDILPEDLRHQFANEMKQAMEKRIESARDAVGQLQAMLEAGKVSTKTLRELAAKLDRNINGLPNSVHFIGEQFNEQMETTTIEAQAEVEARLRGMVDAAGLQSLTTHRDAPEPDTIEASKPQDKLE